MTVLPMIVEPTTEGGILYTVLYPDMPTDLGELQRSWIQLKKEWDTYRDQFYAQERKVLELTKQIHEEKDSMSISAQRGSIHGNFDFFSSFRFILIVMPKRNSNFEFS